MSYYENLLVGELSPVSRHLATEVFSGAGFVDITNYIPVFSMHRPAGARDGSSAPSSDDVFFLLGQGDITDSLSCANLWLFDIWGGQYSVYKKLNVFSCVLDSLGSTTKNCNINVLAPSYMCSKMASDFEVRGRTANYFHIPDVVLHGSSMHVSAGVISDIVRQVIFAALVSQATENGLTLSVPSEKKISFCDVTYLVRKVSEICSAGRQGEACIRAQAQLEVSKLISLVSDAISLGSVSSVSCATHVYTPIETIFSKNVRTACDLLSDNMGVVSEDPCFYKDVIGNVAGFSKELAKSLLSANTTSIFDRVEVESWDGYRINLYTLGDPAKQPLLLVNAYGMPVTFMEPLAQALADDFYLVTWESRGIPSDATEVSEHDLSPSAHVRDGFYIMDLLSLEKSDVIGWCTGAHVALKMALMRRERVGKLILLNGGFNFDNIQDTAFQKNMRHVMVAASGNMGLARLYHSAMYSRSEEQPSIDVSDASEKTMDIFRSTDTSLVHLTGTPYRSPENLFRYASMITRFIQDKDYSGMEEMGEDVLIVSAKDDVTTGYMGSVYLSNCIPGSKISFHPTGDHFLLYNDSEYVCNQVRAFLKSGHHVRPAAKELVDLTI